MMTHRSFVTRTLFASLATGGLLMSLALALHAADAVPGKVTEELGGVERYLTHVSTDKPVYRPGETLYVRGAVLRADTRAPMSAAQEQQSEALVEVRGP